MSDLSERAKNERAKNERAKNERAIPYPGPSQPFAKEKVFQVLPAVVQ